MLKLHYGQIKRPHVHAKHNTSYCFCQKRSFLARIDCFKEITGLHPVCKLRFLQHAHDTLNCGKRRKCWLPAFSPFLTMYHFSNQGLLKPWIVWHIYETSKEFILSN